jgi:hypothetical protein
MAAFLFMEKTMAHEPKKEVQSAMREWLAAPKKNKPAALELARKYGVAESTIHRARARWIKAERDTAREARNA